MKKVMIIDHETIYFDNRYETIEHDNYDYKDMTSEKKTLYRIGMIMSLYKQELQDIQFLCYDIETRGDIRKRIKPYGTKGCILIDYNQILIDSIGIQEENKILIHI